MKIISSLLLLPLLAAAPAQAQDIFGGELLPGEAAPAGPVADDESDEPAFTGPKMAPPPLTTTEDSGTSIFGEPLYVNGKRVPDVVIKRFLCYARGSGAMQARTWSALMHEERNLRIRSERRRQIEERLDGQPYEELTDEQKAVIDEAVDEFMSLYVYDPREVTDRIAREEATFYERYPSLDYDTEVRRAYKSKSWYIGQLHQTLEFDALFFPGPVENWPSITTEAIHGGSPNFDLVEDYRKNHVLRRDRWLFVRNEMEAQVLADDYGGRSRDELNAEEDAFLENLLDAEHGNFEPREDEMMMGLLRDMVKAGLTLPHVLKVETSLDGLPWDQLVTLKGDGFLHVVTTDEVFDEMQHIFSEHDIQEAKLFITLQVLIQDELAKNDDLIDYRVFKKRVEELRQAMGASMMDFGFLALQGFMFPSMESYTEHLYMVDSFKTTIADDLNRDENGNPPQALLDHLPVANGIMGLAKAQVEVILCSAFDFPNFQWAEGGWEKAKAKADGLRARIDAHMDLVASDPEAQPFDRFWDDMLELESDYWDAPLPVSGKMPPMIGMKSKGKFDGRPKTRNDLRRALGESAWSRYLSGDLITDKIFFELERGQVAGPYRGPEGYYIVYVKSKLPPSKPVQLSEERMFGLVQEDYLRTQFTAFGQRLLQEADIKGLDRSEL